MAKQKLDLSQFVAFKTGSVHHGVTENIRCRISAHRNPKFKNKRSIRLYFYQVIADYLKVQKSDRLLILHKNDNPHHLVILKHPKGISLAMPTAPERRKVNYYFLGIVIDCAELPISDHILELIPIFHPKGIIELHINQKDSIL